MDTAQWPQEIVVKPMEQIVVPNGTTTTTGKPSASSSTTSSLERRVRPQKEQAVNCPRCNSTNTKFCYYNNYSLSQPRYFCKTCRRYWTEGGSLRNIPVGGGSRKNKRSSSSSSNSSSISHNSSSSAAAAAAKKLISLPDLVQQNPNINKIYDIHGGQDLNLGFPSSHDFKTISELIQVPNFDGSNKTTNSTTTTTTSGAGNTSHLSALELLTGITTRGLSSFMPMPPIPDPNNNVYSSSSGGGGGGGGGFSLPDQFKVPSLGFSLDGMGIGIGGGGSNNNNGYGNLDQENSNGGGGRLLFPFEDLKQVSTTTTTTTHHHQHQDQVDHQSRDHQNGDSNGYWNGMLGGGSW